MECIRQLENLRMDLYTRYDFDIQNAMKSIDLNGENCINYNKYLL